MTPEELYQANEKLVWFCFHKLRVPERLREDCLEEGRCALWRACRQYDPTIGAFSTYAVPTIYYAMRAYIFSYSTDYTLKRRDCGQIDLATVRGKSLDFESDEGVLFAESVPSPPDEYFGLTEDLVEQFLETLDEGVARDIAEEYLYGTLYDALPTQGELSKKYKRSQPQICRYIIKIKRLFQKFIKEE